MRTTPARQPIPAGGCDLGCRALHALEQSVENIGVFGGVGRELHATADPPEQLDAKLVLEGAYLVADRGGRQVQLGCRGLEAAQPRDRFKNGYSSQGQSRQGHPVRCIFFT